MRVLTHVSPDELLALQKSQRVALVLMGGGAKGAYQVGVWSALWKLGIRRFCTITGTSVGALNALIFSSGDPAFATRIWDRVIAAGVLNDARSLLRGIGAILLSHLLIFLSIILEASLVVAAFLGLALLAFVQARGGPTPHDAGLYFGLIGLLLVFFWLAARTDASFLQRVAAGGYALSLFAGRPAQTKKFVNMAGLVGVMLSVVGGFVSGPPSHHVSGGLLWLLPIAWVGLVALRHQGLRLLHEAVRVRPLFERKSLDEEITRLAREDGLFANCTGPVVATLARHASYDDPLAVHPLERRYAYYGTKGEYALRMAYEGSWRRLVPPIAEWVPDYVDLRKSPDPAWALGASSAIPFAFQAVPRKSKDSLGREITDVFVDGGVVDNLPLLPALEAKPEYVIVVAVNSGDSLDDEETLTRTLQEKLRKSYFSKKENDSEANRIREEWIATLPAGYFEEREALSMELARSEDSLLFKFFPVGASPGPFPPFPKIGPNLDEVKVIFIRPSSATSVNLPIIGLITGTMRFDPAYKRKLAEMGMADTEAMFPTAGYSVSRTRATTAI
jgi:predicted acylesterase/phospholipase RssA